MPTRDFRRLVIWQRAHQLSLRLYKETATFPAHELYGIVSQIRRAAVSVPTNITEGCGRGTVAELRRFLDIATGSLSELEYLLILTNDLKYIPQGVYEELLEEVTGIRRMITVYRKTLS